MITPTDVRILNIQAAASNGAFLSLLLAGAMSSIVYYRSTLVSKSPNDGLHSNTDEPTSETTSSNKVSYSL